MKVTTLAIITAVAISGCGKEGSIGETKATAASPAPVVAEMTLKTSEPKVDKGPWDGPFGLKMGINETELKAAISDIKTASPNIYSTEAPPKPHDAFETYHLVTSSSTGLCKISAVGKDVPTSQFGDELRSAHKSIKDALTERYGKPTDDYNFLKHGSLWTESKYWMMGLLKKDRVLTTIWEQKTEKTPKGINLPNDIDSIIVDVTASGTDSGYVTLRYAFSNEYKCIAENKKEKNKAL